jgi:anti-sigma factor ChrR (cupin superfamily)
MINMNFSERVVITTPDIEWQPSPAKGVWRKRLERESEESGHTTSIVKYEAGSYFKEHGHPGGEEILVLEGVFSDEHGDYGPGAYIRNPPGSTHSPFSKEGCTILVKLNQFATDDLKQLRIDTESGEWLEGIGGLQVMPLHTFDTEHVALVKWPRNQKFQPHRHFGGEEIFVISGEFRDEYGCYPQGTWIRSPHMSQHDPYVNKETVIWVKTGHLPVI